MTKVLVVDDSALMRKLLGQIFAGEAYFEVQFARNGLEALDLIDSFSPDVVTLDIHMPQMDGLACLDRIMVEHPCPVVMVSSLTAEGADTTLEALRLGAVDFVAKPEGAISLHIDALRAELVAKVPLGRFTIAEEVAALVTFLASDQAASITGETVNINGGLYLD